MKIKEKIVAVLLFLTVALHACWLVGCGSPHSHKHQHQNGYEYRDAEGRQRRLPIYQHDPSLKRTERMA